MGFACRIAKTTNTDSEFVILFAFPRLQSLREGASVWRFKYIASIVQIAFTCFVWLCQYISIALISVTNKKKLNGLYNGEQLCFLCGINLVLRELIFSQRRSKILKSFRTLSRVEWYAVTDVSKDRNAFETSKTTFHSTGRNILKDNKFSCTITHNMVTC